MGLSEDLLIRLKLDSAQYKSEARVVARSTDAIADSARDAGKGGREMAGGVDSITTAAKGLLALGVAHKMRKFAGDSIRAATDLNESYNAVNKIFGEADETITEFGANAAESIGMAQSEFQQMSVTTGALFSGMGMDAQEAADNTLLVTQRAADMASVFNTDVKDALFAIQAGLRGETEPLRRYGVQLDAASLSARAVERGLAGSTSEVTKQQRALVAMDEIMAQTIATQGDFADTSDDLANKQRIFNARLEDSKARMGEALVPMMESLLDVGVELLPIMEATGSAIGDIVTRIASIVKPVAEVVRYLNSIELGTDEGKVGSLELGIDMSFTPIWERPGQIWELARNRLEEVGVLDISEPVYDAAEAYEMIADAMTRTGDSDLDAAFFADQVEPIDAMTSALQGTIGPYQSMYQAQIDAANAARQEREAEQAAADALNAKKQAIVDAARAQREASDPVFRKIQAEKRLADATQAYIEIAEDAEATDDDRRQVYLDLIEAQNDAAYAGSELAVNLEESQTAFREQAEAAGLAADEIELLIAALWGIPTSIDTEWNFRINTTGRVPTEAELSDAGVGYIVTKSGIGFADGGQVPGPGQPIIVGERGPEMFIPSSHGRIVPNHQLGAMGSPGSPMVGSSSTTVIINDSPHHDLRDDVATGLFAAGVQDQMEYVFT